MWVEKKYVVQEIKYLVFTKIHECAFTKSKTEDCQTEHTTTANSFLVPVFVLSVSMTLFACFFKQDNATTLLTRPPLWC